MKVGALDAGIVVAYLAAMLGIGVLVSRRIGGFRDFFVAGGRMTTPILVCTLVATYYGMEVSFGTSETAYRHGIAAFFAYSGPFYTSYLVTAVAVVPRLRALGVISLPEAVGHFYGRDARLFAALASFVYSAPVLAVAGLAKVGHAFFGLDPVHGALLGCGIALAYTLLGGLLADAMTDTVHFTFMCVTVALATATALLGPGSEARVREALAGEPSFFRAFGDLGPGEVAVFLVVAATPLVEPAFYQRTFAATDTRAVVRALLLGVVLWIAYDACVTWLGVTGRALVATGAMPAPEDPSAVLLPVVERLLPPGLLGLFVAGVVASAMSAIDSYTVIASGNLVYDAAPRFLRRPLDDRELLLWSRCGVAVTLAFSLAVGLWFDSIRDAWIFTAGVLGSTVLVPMMAALFLPWWATPRAGLWSAATGFGTMALVVGAVLVAGVDGPGGPRVVVAGIEVGREQAVLVTLPAAALAFVAGHLADRRARR